MSILTRPRFNLIVDSTGDRGFDLRERPCNFSSLQCNPQLPCDLRCGKNAPHQRPLRCLAIDDQHVLPAKALQGRHDMANLGVYGRFLNVRYRARWLTKDGETVAQVAGIAKPRNPLETGPRHIEDVVEVMYEMMVEGLNKAGPVPAQVERSAPRIEGPTARPAGTSGRKRSPSSI